MRTTVPIDDDLLAELREYARHEGSSLAKAFNRVLRQGMKALREQSRPGRPYREKTFNMGSPGIDVTKALTLAAAMEDGEILEKLARRK